MVPSILPSPVTIPALGCLVVVETVRRERAQLEEGAAGVDEAVDPFADRELAALAVAGDGAFIAAGATFGQRLLPGAEVVDESGHRRLVGPDVVGCGFEPGSEDGHRSDHRRPTEPTVVLRRRGAMVRLTAVLVLALAAVGCTTTPVASSPPMATGSPSPSASLPASPVPTAPLDDPLLTLTTRGGECPDGACMSVVVIERTGRVHDLEPAPAERGAVRPDVMLALQAAVDAADFASIKSHPFTGECPVNFDGQEQIYEFSTDAGVERIASCEVEIDPEHPLFTTVEAALATLPR